MDFESRVIFDFVVPRYGPSTCGSFMVVLHWRSAEGVKVKHKEVCTITA